MANVEIDFQIGKYALFRINKDGPSRLQGNTTYESLKRAKEAAEKYLRANSHVRVTIFRVEGTYWLDPKPKVMSDEPEICEEPKP